MRLISYAQANQGSQHVQNTGTVWGKWVAAEGDATGRYGTVHDRK